MPGHATEECVKCRKYQCQPQLAPKLTVGFVGMLQ